MLLLLLTKSNLDFCLCCGGPVWAPSFVQREQSGHLTLLTESSLDSWGVVWPLGFVKGSSSGLLVLLNVQSLDTFAQGVQSGLLLF